MPYDGSSCRIVIGRIRVVSCQLLNHLRVACRAISGAGLDPLTSPRTQQRLRTSGADLSVKLLAKVQRYERVVPSNESLGRSPGFSVMCAFEPATRADGLPGCQSHRN
jgi:hypothetical protein